jgi:hypothetical protein
MLPHIPHNRKPTFFYFKVAVLYACFDDIEGS